MTREDARIILENQKVILLGLQTLLNDACKWPEANRMQNARERTHDYLNETAPTR